MEQLRYVGSNKPYGMVVEVEEKDVERLLVSGEYERLDKPPKKERKGVVESDNSKRVK